ncbi:DUF4880 domain-containing protein [Caulobacter segnis]|uniref:FecR family protein n=1 Tax=Caulobacter segnis TaxID=88688 RepID=UPI00240FCC76|nr:DUF4880 domain-containing protein [Caulobacter segnis]MDG2520669.1 DUF4880 domain-containing protein [Caulobacter segnis]
MSRPSEKIPTAIMEAAGAWVARLHADDRTRQDEARFRAWLAADPRHAEAFDRVTLVFEAAATGLKAEKPRRTVDRRAVFAGLGAVCAGGVGIGLWSTARSQTIETAVGERRSVDLGGGCSLVLDTDTKVRVRRADSLHLQLDRGRINLAAAMLTPDGVVLEGGGCTLTATAVNADVRLELDGLSAAVLSGRARMDGPSGPGVVLVAGDRVDAAGRVDRPSMDKLTAWRLGRLVFDEDRLGSACAELNRYSATPLVADPAVADLKVSGVYQTGRSLDFARAAAQILPVDVVRRDGVIRLTPRAGGAG